MNQQRLSALRRMNIEPTISSLEDALKILKPELYEQPQIHDLSFYRIETSNEET